MRTTSLSVITILIKSKNRFLQNSSPIIFIAQKFDLIAHDEANRRPGLRTRQSSGNHFLEICKYPQTDT